MSHELRIGLVIPWACPWVHGVLEGIGEAVQSRRSWAVRMADPVDADVRALLAVRSLTVSPTPVMPVVDA